MTCRPATADRTCRSRLVQGQAWRQGGRRCVVISAWRPPGGPGSGAARGWYGKCLCRLGASRQHLKTSRSAKPRTAPWERRSAGTSLCSHASRSAALDASSQAYTPGWNSSWSRSCGRGTPHALSPAPASDSSRQLLHAGVCVWAAEQLLSSETLLEGCSCMMLHGPDTCHTPLQGQGICLSLQMLA